MSPIMFGFAIQRKKILESEIERFITEMPAFGAKKIILIGDLVNGKINSDSGIELIITQDTNDPHKDRSDFWITHLRPSVKTDFHVFTPEEFDSLCLQDNFVTQSLSFGETLYDG
tara:strand:- start:9558 stop:9902 length:345 start_codon:yes stop_codon:yes gene_type:complete